VSPLIESEADRCGSPTSEGVLEYFVRIGREDAQAAHYAERSGPRSAVSRRLR